MNNLIKSFMLMLFALTTAQWVQAEDVARVEGSGIGSGVYSSLQTALENAPSGAIVTLLKNTSENITIIRSVTINGDGHTLQSTNRMQITTNGDVTLKSLTFISPQHRGIQIPSNSGSTVGGPTLTIENCTISAESAAIQINVAYTQVNIKNSTIKCSSISNDNNYSEVDYPFGICLGRDYINVNLENTIIKGFKNAIGTEGSLVTSNCKVTMTGGATYGLNTAFFGSNEYYGRDNSVTLDGVDIHTQYLAEFGHTSSIGPTRQTIIVKGASGKNIIPTSGKIIADESELENKTFLMNELAANDYENIFETYKIISSEANPGYYTITPKTYVAQIGTVKYWTLKEAIEAANVNETIEILKDFTLSTISSNYNVVVNKSVTIDGKGYTITSSEGKCAFAVEGAGNNVTFKDLTVKNNSAEACVYILSGLNCTLNHTTLDGTNGITNNQPLVIGSNLTASPTVNITNGSVIKTNNSGTAHSAIVAMSAADINVTDSKLIGWSNIYLKSGAQGSNVSITGSEMVSQGISGEPFGIIVTEGSGNTITVNNTAITGNAVEGTYQSLVYLGTGTAQNVIKFLGTTTYTTNDMKWGAAVNYWLRLMHNKIYFDDTAKAAFTQYFDGTYCATISDTKDTNVNLYPVVYAPEVHYYWPTGNGNYQGPYCRFIDPFENTDDYTLLDGGIIELQKDITIDHDITNPLEEGTITILFGNYNISFGDYSLKLNVGQTILTDKQTTLFSSAVEGYTVQETATNNGYSYTLVEEALDYDINQDGIVNIADVTALAAIVTDDDLNGPNWIHPYYNHDVIDVNQDGIVNIADVTELVNIVLNSDDNE